MYKKYLHARNCKNFRKILKNTGKKIQKNFEKNIDQKKRKTIKSKH